MLKRISVVAVVLLVILGITTYVGRSDLTAKVTGLVSLDGKPLKIEEGQRGTIVFRPVDGGPTTMAILNNDGTYALNTGAKSSIAPADYIVAFRLVELVESEDPNYAPSGKPLTPAMYADPLRSGLQFSIASGDNRCDIKLDSTKGPVMPIEPIDLDKQAEESDTEIIPEKDDSSTY